MMPRSAGTTLVICAAAVWTAAAGAIDIQVTFNNGMSETYTVDGDDRTLDLIPIFEAAAARWEEFYLDAYTVQISYWWEDVPDPIARNFTDDGVGLITATIRINTIPSWWFDPTPFDDSEFSPMQPYLFRDLPGSEQNEAFRTGHSRAQWPDSKHNAIPPLLSQAVDLVPWHRSAPHIRWGNEREFVYLAGHMMQAAHDLGVTIRWGGDWDRDEDLYDRNVPFDLGHFERVRMGVGL